MKKKAKKVRKVKRVKKPKITLKYLADMVEFYGMLEHGISYTFLRTPVKKTKSKDVEEKKKPFYQFWK